MAIVFVPVLEVELELDELEPVLELPLELDVPVVVTLTLLTGTVVPELTTT